MECEPPVSAEVVQVATALLLSATEEQPEMAVAPSLKVADPVTVRLPEPLEDGATVAVKVTDWLTVEGLVAEVRVVVVAAVLMDCVSTADVLVE